MSHCSTTKHLLAVAAGYERSLAHAAKSALMIIADIREHGPKSLDFEYLHAILDEIFKASGVPLSDHLTDGEPDCDICAAIKKRITA